MDIYKTSSPSKRCVWEVTAYFVLSDVLIMTSQILISCFCFFSKSLLLNENGQFDLKTINNITISLHCEKKEFYHYAVCR